MKSTEQCIYETPTAEGGALSNGYVARGLEGVRDAFEENLRSGLDIGATFAVARGDELLVDLWGGHMDERRSQLLGRDALFNLYSTTKGLAATCIAILVDRGKLDYEAKVADYWPQFGVNGKSGITLGQLMSHQAGICGPVEPCTIEDYYAHDNLASKMAAQRPFFTPGSAWGYHALAIGILTDELVRRVDGRTLGAFFAAEVATAMSLDAYLGLPVEEDERQARMIRPDDGTILTSSAPNPEAARAAFENPILDPEWPNDRRWRAAGLPAAGGSANARSLARLYGVLSASGEFAGKRLLSLNAIRAATKERIAGIDQATGVYDRYAAGFRLNVNNIMGPSAHAFGHSGWGGSMACGDPERGIGVAYAMNRMVVTGPEWADARFCRLIKATYESKIDAHVAPTIIQHLDVTK
jgi:CubicO group peptidase (beta-lactamase class C family)